MPVLTRRASSSYVIEQSKIIRIEQVVLDAFEKINSQPSTICTVEHSNGTMVVLDSIAELFNLDNTKKNPIKRLDIDFSSSDSRENNGGSPEVSVANEKKSLVCKISFDDDDRNNIWVMVESGDSYIANSTFENLFEQIERLYSKGIFYSLKKNFMVLVLMLTSLFMAANIFFMSYTSQARTTLSKSIVADLVKKSSSVLSESSKIDFLYQVKLQELQLANGGAGLDEILKKPSILAILLPLLIALLLMGYSFFRLYPMHVFAWGDMKDVYASIVERRRNIFWCIIIAAIVSLISSTFQWGLASSLLTK